MPPFWVLERSRPTQNFTRLQNLPKSVNLWSNLLRPTQAECSSGWRSLSKFVSSQIYWWSTRRWRWGMFFFANAVTKDLEDLEKQAPRLFSFRTPWPKWNNSVVVDSCCIKVNKDFWVPP